MNSIFSILLSMTVALFGGAAGMGEENPTPPAKEAPAHAYDIVPAPYSDSIKQALNEIRTKGGFKTIHENGKSYIVISAGQRPTGGYQLTVTDVRKQADGSWLIQTAVKKPAPGHMVTQVLTYPTIVIALPDAQANVSVQF
ncbi:protease complex subunit PrcB family protein [Brevibacillus migulae]|uniref:protease complex subunit PrcB family protein n=1 Tax=Brevibacillus migulae TaxID=1644114 RepID=UPI00106DEE0E|nr:protease complex subunit PrcB family protein [Brevibacillus migulae]